MEKQMKSSKLKVLKFLPNLFSPTRANAGKLIPGPLSIIPVEARLQPKSLTSEAHEPTSPKISCMGRIKQKKAAKEEKVRRRKSRERHASLPRDSKPIKICHVLDVAEKPAGRKPDPSGEKSAAMADRAPTLSQMKRFASGRDSLTSFERAGEISPAEGGFRHCYSDGGVEREDEEVKNPFSAPILLNGVVLTPKKEINLWKRRPMAQPRPLRV